MATKEVKIAPFESIQDLKTMLATQYIKQINNFFGDEKKALKFLSNVVAEIQRTPKLLECTPESVINSFIMMASLELMPSGVSGEAYVIPYKKKGRLEAQFQLGYLGLVTLFYRAGVKDIVAEIVYEEDDFSQINGKIHHAPDVFSDKRGKPKGAYVIVRTGTGGEVAKVMSGKEILNIGKQFSKSYKSDYSPWNPKNDPLLWMWKKTVLKQAAKLVPKNETIVRAISEDNKDSIIGDRLEAAKEDIPALAMGNVLKSDNENGDGNKDEGGKKKKGTKESETKQATEGDPEIGDGDIPGLGEED